MRKIIKKGLFDLSHFLPDKMYLKMRYYFRMGRSLDLDNPETFNEKLQWLKLYDRKSKYTMMVDKYEVRNYIANIVGEEYLIPLLGVWDNPDEIDFESLPNQFVLKATHDSGGYVIVRDKNKLDIEAIKKKLNSFLKKDFYWHGREWPYKNVKPRIICEEFLNQNDGKELRDYRFFCFNGEPKFITVDFSITEKKRTRRNLYDLQWNLMDEEITYPKEEHIKVEAPAEIDKMIELSRILSSNIPHVRVDFYYIDNKIKFGELTFFHQSGWGNIRPEEFNYKMGSWLELPVKTSN